MKLFASAFVIATAIVSQPFVAEVAKGFGKYHDLYAARDACRDWSSKGENRKCGEVDERQARQRHWYGYVKDAEGGIQIVTRFYF